MGWFSDCAGTGLLLGLPTGVGVAAAVAGVSAMGGSYKPRRSALQDAHCGSRPSRTEDGMARRGS